MSGYRRPKQQLHREFLYLNHDAVLNSLSALEAGKIDEIILKATEASEGGLDAHLAAGPVRAGGGKKKSANIHEELVRTRTRFSAFDAWMNFLVEADGFGTFTSWDEDVLAELEVGDTVMFKADLSLSPVHKVLRTFLAFAEQAGNSASPFAQKGSELASTKKAAAQMLQWMGGRDKPQHLPMYVLPLGVDDPRMLARLEDQYLVRGGEGVEGRFTVIGQIDQVLEGDDLVSAIRLIRDVPPTPLELKAITDGMAGMIEAAEEMGVSFGQDDINVPAPAVVLHPIAIYK